MLDLRAACLAVGLLTLAACGDSPGAALDLPSQAGAPAAVGTSVSTLKRWPLDRLTTSKVIVSETPGMEYDPLTYFRRLPNAHNKFVFQEHPKGVFYFVTNSDSLREDQEVRQEKPDLRVLVTGDSHTDGVCENAESYTNVLEALLSERDPKRSVEALNAGLGGYSFYNYLGVLEKYARLEPDLFLVGVYGGNDFGEVLSPWHYFQGTVRPPGAADYKDRMDAAQLEGEGRGRQAIAQGFNQAIYFDYRPEQIEVALTAAREVMREIQRQCVERGIELLVLYIPPPADIEYQRFQELFDAVTGDLELDAEAVRISQRLGDAFLESMHALGIASLDGRDALRGADVPLYWQQDQHINIEAHRRLAQQLLPVVEELARIH